jgi:ATP/maltotriose-dependent transcriptional regulator MalT
VALTRLGRPAACRRVLEAALGSLDPEMVKTRPRLLSALATAHVQQGNINEACRIGADVLALADRQQVTTNLQDVRRLRLDLEPWRDTEAVRGLRSARRSRRYRRLGPSHPVRQRLIVSTYLTRSSRPASGRPLQAAARDR